MIMIRIYRALGEMVVEGTAHVVFDEDHNPIEPRAFFIGREYVDATSSIGADEISGAVYEMLKLSQLDATELFGGHQALL